MVFVERWMLDGGLWVVDGGQGKEGRRWVVDCKTWRLSVGGRQMIVDG